MGPAVSAGDVRTAETMALPAGARGISNRFAVMLLLTLSAVIYMSNAGHPALLDDADASHAVVSREILQRSDWVVLHMNGIRYLTKAPLHYWVVALSYKLLGQSAFSTRLPVALAVVGLVLLVYAFGRRFFGNRAGFYSGLVVCTSAGIFLFTRIMIPEAIYALEFTAIFYLFLRGWTGTLSPRTAYWCAAALTALAVLTRGLVGAIFPATIIGLFITATMSWHRWRELRLFSSSLIFLVIAVPWHVLAEMRAPGFFWSYFINEHLKRALGTRYPPDYEAVPLLIWWVAHLAWFFPWSAFWAGPIRGIPHPRRWKRLTVEGQARLLVYFWAGFILLFFSLTFGSRMEYYSFGAWPAIALLLGTGLAEAEQESRRWVQVTQGALAALGVAVAVVLGTMLWVSSGAQVKGDISSLLQHHPNDYYRVSMAHFFDLTPQAFAALRTPSTMAGVAFFAGFCAAWWLRRKKHDLGANVLTALTMSVFFFAANLALGLFGPYLSSRPLLQAVEGYIHPEDTLVLYGEFDAGSSIAFYTHRRLLIYNGRYNNLAAGSYYPDAPHIFLRDADFPPLWQSAQRVFLFVPEQQREAARQRLHATGTYLAAESGGKAVYANHLLTSGQASLGAGRGHAD